MSAVGDVRGKVSRRVDSGRNLVSNEVRTIFNGKAVSGVRKGADDLLSLKPVQAVTDVVEGVVGQGVEIIGGTVGNVTNFIREQARITREGRV